MKVDSSSVYGYLTQYQCPLCGHRLYRDGNLVWCSHVSAKGTSCQYGVDTDITLDEHLRRIRATPKALPQPDGEGFWVFTGIRRTASGSYIKSVRDLCEIVAVPVGMTEKMVAYFFRRSKPVVIDLMEGEFTRVFINLGGERLRE